MKRTLLLLALLLSAGLAFGQFTDVNAGLTGIAGGACAWADLDTDGDLDLLLSGAMDTDSTAQRVTKVYRNDGNTAFTEIVCSLPGLTSGCVTPGDFDNDGDPDLLLTGLIGSYNPVSRLYRNDGNFSFTQAGQFQGVEFGSAAWGDCDNDGDLDLLICGMPYDEYYVSNLYKNNGNGSFTHVDAGFEGLSEGSAAWGDFDCDGDLDVLINGWNWRQRLTIVYENDGNSGFADYHFLGPGVSGGSADWTDCDGDGDLDILVSGFSGTTRIMNLYKYQGGGYVNASASFPPSAGGKVAWADYDRDGLPDLLHQGYNGTSSVTQVFRNNGGNTFNDINAGLPGGSGACAAWGDFDNDLDPDLLVCARDSLGNRISRIYRNDWATPPPAPPANLQTYITTGGDGPFTFSWEAVTTDIAGNPVTPDHYLILAGTDPFDEACFSLIATTDELSFTDPEPGSQRFYKVVAVYAEE